jgi:hypothetical protein
VQFKEKSYFSLMGKTYVVVNQTMTRRPFLKDVLSREEINKTYRMKRKGKHLPGGSIPGYMVLVKPEKKIKIVNANIQKEKR